MGIWSTSIDSRDYFARLVEQPMAEAVSFRFQLRHKSGTTIGL